MKMNIALLPHSRPVRCLIRAVIGACLLSALGLFITFTAEPYIARLQAAQQQVQAIPLNGSQAGLAITANTILTNVANGVALLKQGSSGLIPSTQTLSGSKSIYGYSFMGAAPCYIQVFDTYPASVVTVGTTVPQVALPVIGNSALGIQVYPLPIFTIDSALVVSATTTPTGNTACLTPPVGSIIYNK